MEDNKKNKVDYKTLNELIRNGNFLLRITLTMFILAIGAIVMYLLDKTSVLLTIGKIFGILSPLFIGIVLAWLLEPGIHYFEKNNVGRKLSVFTVYLIFLFSIILILALIVPEFVSQLNELIRKVPDFLSSINKFINNTFSNFSTNEIDLSSVKNTILESVNSFVNNVASEYLTGIVGKVGTSLKTVTNIILGLLIAFYISLDFSKFSKYVNKIVPKKFSDDLAMIKKSLNNMLRGYVNGTLVSCLFVLILSLIGFLISGISSPLLFAIFCAITNIIPYFGPYIGGIPVIVVGFAISPFAGITCLVTVFLVQFLEGNILHPLIIGKAISLHPITMMLSLLVFEYFFGITGMIIAAPIVATLKIISIFLEEKYHFTKKIKI